NPKVSVGKVSGYHETEPVGGPQGQGKYLNAAAQLQTDLSPEDLLKVLLEIEAKFGRVRSEPNAPRTLDLDLLLYDDLIRADQPPMMPHPRMHQRSFVLEPLAEIAPQHRHPSLGITIKRLAENLRPSPPPGLPLAGKKALVTGSTSGIGEAIAEAFAAAGAWVIVHGRNPERAKSVAEELRRHDVASDGMAADLRGTSACEQLAIAAWDLWDGLDLFVSNAGADTLTGEAAN